MLIQKMQTIISTNPTYHHIRVAEVYFAYLLRLMLENVKVNAVAYFKVSLKPDFLHLEKKEIAWNI